MMTTTTTTTIRANSPTAGRVPAARAMFALAAVLLACGVAELWPGDAPWINDEPRLIAHALRANAHWRPAGVGLQGSFLLKYGPLPTQVYQLLLFITHDPVTLVALRAGLFVGITAAALGWLSRELRLTPWFIPAVLLAPHTWFSARQLWDNSFAMPAGAIAVAAYATFLVRRSGPALLVAFASLLGLLSIHLMTLPLVGAIAAHALWRHRAALRAHRVGLVAVLLVAALTSANYVTEYAASARRKLAERHSATARAEAATVAPAAADPEPERLPRLAALVFPWRGAAALGGGTPLSIPLPREGLARPLVGAADWTSWGLASALLAGGLALALRQAVRVRHGRAAPTPRDTVIFILSAALAAQMLVDAALRVRPYVHYFHGTWICYVCLAWLAADALARRHRRWGWTVTALYAAASTVIVLATAVEIHRTGGSRGPYGPTIANQYAVARSMGAFADQTVATDVRPYLQYPHALSVLRELVGAPAAAAGGFTRSGRPYVRYRSADPEDGRIEAVEIPPGSPDPDGSARVTTGGTP